MESLPLKRGIRAPPVNAKKQGHGGGHLTAAITGTSPSTCPPCLSALPTNLFPGRIWAQLWSENTGPTVPSVPDGEALGSHMTNLHIVERRPDKSRKAPSTALDAGYSVRAPPSFLPRISSMTLALNTSDGACGDSSGCLGALTVETPCLSPILSFSSYTVTSTQARFQSQEVSQHQNLS